MTACTACGHTDDTRPAPEPAEGFLPGENWARRMNRMAREFRDWLRTEEQQVIYAAAGTTAIKLHGRRGDRERIVHVDILPEVDRHGRPDPDRVWHRYPDGTMTQMFVEPETRDRSDGGTFRLPTAMQARHDAMSPNEVEESRQKVEPVSSDPNDWRAPYVAVKVR